MKKENTLFTGTHFKILQKLFICFMFYAIFGWCYEVFLEVVIYRWGFTNRGVLFGPYCPVYGVGATVFLLAFYKYKNESDKPLVQKIITIFIGCMLSATLIELLTSYILEALTGAWPWQTYTDYAIHFQGRIALSPSIRFGIGGILFLYVMQPLFDYGLARLKEKQIATLSCIMLVILLVDFTYVMFCKG